MGVRATPHVVCGVIALSILLIPAGASALSLPPRSSGSSYPTFAALAHSIRGCDSLPTCSRTSATLGSGNPSTTGTFDPAATLAWSELPTSVPAQTLGSGAGMVADAAAAIAFGGDGANGLSAVTSAYTESTNSWSVVSTTGAPSARSDFAFGFDPTAGKAVLFGGLVNATSGSVTNDTWTYDVSSKTWTNVTGSSLRAPGPREDAAFAIDPSLGVGLLFGGQNPNYESVGTVTYSDLWEIDLTSNVWTPITPASGARPPPLEGAALAWDSAARGFEMYGGCAPCSNGVWLFNLTSAKWTELPASPASPSPAAGASWAYDPELNADLLFGGTDGSTQFNETSIFYPNNDTWVSQTLPGPSARSEAAAAYLNVSGNATWLLAGGSTPLGPVTDTWRLSTTSDLALRVENASGTHVPLAGASVMLNGDSFGVTSAQGYLNLSQINGVDSNLRVSDVGYFSSSTTLWLAPGSSTAETVLLTVIPPRDLATIRVTVRGGASVPVFGAAVNLTINGTLVNAQPGLTSLSGEVNFTRVPPGDFDVSVNAAAWRSNSSAGIVAAGGTVNVTIGLLADPFVLVSVTGHLPGGAVTPLEGSSVFLNGVAFVVTPPGGFIEQQTAALGLCNVTAYALGYDSSSLAINVPLSGTVNASLLLDSLPPGGIHARVTDLSDGLPVPQAQVDADSSGPLPSGWLNVSAYTFTSGWANLSVLEGFYEVNAIAPGFLSSAPVVVHALPSENQSLSIALDPEPGANISFLVRASTNLTPIVRANVSIANYRNGVTGPGGYFNLTEVPAGTYVVTAVAPGYYANTSVFTFTFYENATVPINLTPHMSAAVPPSHNLFQFLGSNAGALWALLLVPGLLALGGFVYLAVTRATRGYDELGRGPVRDSAGAEPPPEIAR
jgi:hypothetical protein